MSRERRATFPCPHCAEPVPEGARACWSCGSDEFTGWKDPDLADAEGVELAETSLDDADYADFLAREGLSASDGEGAVQRMGRTFGVAFVALLLVLLLLFGFVL